MVRVLTGVGNPLCYPFGCHYYYYYIKNCSKTHVARVSHTHRQMLWFANADWDIMSSMWLDFGWIWSVYVSLVVCIKCVCRLIFIHLMLFFFSSSVCAWLLAFA